MLIPDNLITVHSPTQPFDLTKARIVLCVGEPLPQGREAPARLTGLPCVITCEPAGFVDLTRFVKSAGNRSEGGCEFGKLGEVEIDRHRNALHREGEADDVFAVSGSPVVDRDAVDRLSQPSVLPDFPDCSEHLRRSVKGNVRPEQEAEIAIPGVDRHGSILDIDADKISVLDIDAQGAFSLHGDRHSLSPLCDDLGKVIDASAESSRSAGAAQP